MPVFTYHTRLKLEVGPLIELDNYAELYCRVERSLYADMIRSGKPSKAFKTEYLLKYGLTARQFNAIRINLDGKISSVMELLPIRIQELEFKIKELKKVLAKKKGKFVIHQKKRKLSLLESRLAAFQEQLANQDPRICFGSRKLFRQQFQLEINGFHNHAEWKAVWDAKRSSQFYVLGSGDESCGCQGCTITACDDGSYTFKLRKPGKESTYITIPGVHFQYGAEAIANAVAFNDSIRAERNAVLKRNAHLPPKERAKAPLGIALSYRFLRDEKGWRLFVLFESPAVKPVTCSGAGAFGVDINEDCLAVSETDRNGNLVGSFVVPLVTYGKSSHQAEALIGNAVRAVVAKACFAGKMVVLEKLDFAKKKAELESVAARRSRMLSSFSYNKIITFFRGACFRAGIQFKQVNPAYTSVIGAINYASRYGISVHQAAAFAIARRGSGCRELPTTKEALVPTLRGDHVTFTLPVRNRAKHVWSFWAGVKTIYTEVLAAHTRSQLCRSNESSPIPEKRKKCPVYTVESRISSRRHNCSAGADLIPW